MLCGLGFSQFHFQAPLSYETFRESLGTRVAYAVYIDLL